ncbi:hypothetical protein BpHYR1_042282 [Brachionus plicatilis]|uniref:Uncharacterized protein n=1 Tax=Brachionus plicatilis TaxID=10195 RepID=A0A3M7R604_BRAPC|nr:hypothetical protein BpHYR1_042282 [Brachionus plicatilis]
MRSVFLTFHYSLVNITTLAKVLLKPAGDSIVILIPDFRSIIGNDGSGFELKNKRKCLSISVPVRIIYMFAASFNQFPVVLCEFCKFREI